MRRKPWEFIEKVTLGIGSSAEVEWPTMLVVTGMGGCGKTQLILKFIDVHKNR
jgi:GTPase SAR1 family protein